MAQRRKKTAAKPPAGPVEVFPNPRPDREYVISFDCPEYTSVCPKTGLPDFGTLTITYAPAEHCLEMKSLKMHLFGYRNQGVFYEAAVNRILDELVASCRPRWMEIEGDFTARGGMSARITARFPD